MTDREQSEPPPIWRGGIIADEMGLGKTLSAIALVASDQQNGAEHLLQNGYSSHTDVLQSTLIVVPPNGMDSSTPASRS